jgi:hypothetical protein
MSFPKLVANDNYQKADIRDMGIGDQNYGSPENAPVIYQGACNTGQEFAGAEGQRLCARREAIPGNPNTPYGNWVGCSGVAGIQEGEPVATGF